jgi:hypothetical protein
METAPVKANHKAVSARFEMDPIYGPVCIQKIGYEEGAATSIERITDHHIRSHPAEYARFKSSRASLAVVGMPLIKLGVPAEVVTLFNAHAIMDVETLATIPDSKFYQMMQGDPEFGIELRERAKAMIPEEKRTPLVGQPARSGPASREDAVQEIETLKAKLALAERERADALAMLELATPPIGATDEPEDLSGEGEAEEASEGQNLRRGPGRPRKVA